MIAAGIGFVAELARLGYEAIDLGDGHVTFPYEIPVGPRAGESLTIGFVVPTDFPLSCPSGPYLRPRLLPLNPDGTAGHPLGAVHPAPAFGEDWEYLSRPFPGWHQSERTARAYLAHIANLFSTIP
ncbi:MAG: hypothetical protein ACYDAK_02910 [Candidatus Limnocylindrales bacterium]